MLAGNARGTVCHVARAMQLAAGGSYDRLQRLAA